MIEDDTFNALKRLPVMDMRKLYNFNVKSCPWPQSAILERYKYFDKLFSDNGWTIKEYFDKSRDKMNERR